jgi:hypothetical protein
LALDELDSKGQYPMDRGFKRRCYLRDGVRSVNNSSFARTLVKELNAQEGCDATS